MTQPQCPQCQSLTVYFKVRSNSYQCRRCGHTWPKDKDSKGAKTMKTLLLATVLSLTASFVNAYEVEGNPDRYISFALGYEGGTLKGDSTLDVLFATNAPGVFAGGADTLDEEVKVTSIRPSVRIPVSSTLTLDVFGSFVQQEFKHVTDGFDWQGDVDGTLIGGTLWWYLK